jgi:hypothetical protein
MHDDNPLLDEVEILDDQPAQDQWSKSTSKVSDADHLKVFATVDAAETWFEGNGIESVAFELRPQPEVGGKPNCANSEL